MTSPSRRSGGLEARVTSFGGREVQGWDAGVAEGTSWRFQSERVWLGSANWTRLSREKHLEFGLWIDDAALVAQATSFVTDLIDFFEPIDSVADLPAPELTDYEPDPAMWEEWGDEETEP